MKKIAFILALVIIPMLLLSPVLVSAETTGGTGIGSKIQKNLGEVGEEVGFKKQQTLPELVGLVITVFLSLLGVIFIILIIYGGYTWMTAGGNDEKIKKAKSLIVDAVIGIAIILAAYAITNFVIENLVKATVN